ncbi:unnamed protein product [Moneuplotes crassus]|uniref:Cyclic nucleotide-binding domain-containing protein n=1 Tax=Euplotes crassus TaxID=5936 RepID=A0AAD2CVH3_EUPCR|nr:unnamed protein product [Moneuplotes crassus]
MNLYLNNLQDCSKEDFKGVDQDVYPAIIQAPELYHADEDILEMNNFYYNRMNKQKKKKKLCCDKILCKKKTNRIEEISKLVPKEQTRRNWEVFKEKTIEYLRMQKIIRGAQKLKRGFDRSDLNLEEEQYRFQDFLLHPENSKRIFFENLIALIYIIDLYANIYSLCFEADITVFDLSIIPVYLLEIYISCVSMIWHDMILIKDIKKILKNYLKRNFIVDLINILPFFLLKRELKALKFIKAKRLRIYFSRVLTMIYEFCSKRLKLKEHSLKVIEKGSKFLAALFLTLHVIACINSYFGKTQEDGWVNKNKGLLRENYNHFDIYIAAVYWTMTTFTTIGYGDFTASTNSEYLMQCFIMLMGIGFFGYIVGNVSTIFMQAESITHIKNMYEEEFNLWLIRLNKAKNSKIMRNEYFTYGARCVTSKWDKDFCELKNNEFFSNLKPRIQKETSDQLFSSVYDTYDGFFKGTDKGFMRAIVHAMKYEVHEQFPPYTTDYKKPANHIPVEQTCNIIPQGKIPTKLIFVKEGVVYGGNSTGRYVYFRLKKGSYFGEGYILNQKPSSYSINYFRDESACLFSVENIDLVSICQSYPSSFEKIRKRSISRRRVFRKMKYNSLREIITETLQKNYKFGEDAGVDLNSIRTAMYNVILKNISLKETILRQAFLQSARNEQSNDSQDSIFSELSAGKFQDGSGSLSKDTSRKLKFTDEDLPKISLNPIEKGSRLPEEEKALNEQQINRDSETIKYHDTITPFKEYDIYGDIEGISSDSDCNDESMSVVKKVLSRNKNASLSLNKHWAGEITPSQRIPLGLTRTLNFDKKIKSFQSNGAHATSSFKKEVLRSIDDESESDSNFSGGSSEEFNTAGPIRNSTYFTKSSNEDLPAMSTNKVHSSKRKVRIHMRRSTNKYYSMNKFEQQNFEETNHRRYHGDGRIGPNKFCSPTLSSKEEEELSYKDTLQNQFVKKYISKEDLKRRFFYLNNELYNLCEGEELEEIKRYTSLAKNRRKNEIFEEVLIESEDDLESEFDQALKILQFDIDPVIHTTEMAEKVTKSLISETEKSLTICLLNTSLSMNKFNDQIREHKESLNRCKRRSSHLTSESQKILRKSKIKYKLGEQPTYCSRRVRFC